MKKFLITCLFLLFAKQFFGENKIDSLLTALNNSKEDTNKVNTFSELTSYYFYIKPDSTYFYAKQGYDLAKKIHFEKGEIDNLIQISASLSALGNFDKALESELLNLKLNEKKGATQGLFAVIYTLCNTYYNQKQTGKAIDYGMQGLQIAEKIKNMDDKMAIVSLIGGCYEQEERFDSALYFLNEANEISLQMKNPQNIAFAQTDLAELYIKMKMDKLALEYYRLAMPYIIQNQIDEALCESWFNMADIFKRSNQNDSAMYYGKKTFDLASHDNFPVRKLNASEFLSSFYESTGHTDSAFKYLKLTVALKDSIFSQQKLQAAQNLTFNENIRQQEIAEQKKKDEEAAKRNLQLIAIAAFIPIFFLIVLFLARIKVKPRVIEFLAIVDLLLFFEFITDLIYPYVSNLTNEQPIWEMLTLVTIAALLEPLNFRLEHWVKKHLVHKHHQPVVQPIINEQSI